MKYLLVVVAAVLCLAMPAYAMEISAPKVPDVAEEYMPSDPQNLLEGIREVIHIAVSSVRPDIREAASVCIGMIAVAVILSILRTFPGISSKTADLAGAICLSTQMLSPTTALINLAADTVMRISDYGKMLLAPMTAALAAQGGITSSTALYAGTAVFDALLSSVISNLLIPLTYAFLAVAITVAGIGEGMLIQCRDLIKSSITWTLKTVLYVFTGFIGITGVISGSTDAAALKAAKLTISGVVPVVGGILADASEAVLVSAGTVKNAAGLYGLFALAAIWCGPFVKIGVHYLMLRFTGAVCSIFGGKRISSLIQDFSTAMGMMLGMTGAVCMMFLISLMCFMKGVG